MTHRLNHLSHEQRRFLYEAADGSYECLKGAITKKSRDEAVWADEYYRFLNNQMRRLIGCEHPCSAPRAETFDRYVLQIAIGWLPAKTLMDSPNIDAIVDPRPEFVSADEDGTPQHIIAVRTAVEDLNVSYTNIQRMVMSLSKRGKYVQILQMLEYARMQR